MYDAIANCQGVISSLISRWQQFLQQSYVAASFGRPLHSSSSVLILLARNLANRIVASSLSNHFLVPWTHRFYPFSFKLNYYPYWEIYMRVFCRLSRSSSNYGFSFSPTHRGNWYELSSLSVNQFEFLLFYITIRYIFAVDLTFRQVFSNISYFKISNTYLFKLE